MGILATIGIMESIPMVYYEDENIIRALRISYLDRDRRQSRYIFNTKNEADRQTLLHSRRDDRQWRNGLYKLTAFTQVVAAGDMQVATDVMDALRQCKGIVLMNLNLKQMLGKKGREIEKRFEFLRILSDMHEHLTEKEKNLAKELAVNIKALLFKTPINPFIKRPDLVGKAGTASTTEGGQHGYLVMALDLAIPEITNRYALIARLLNHAGLDISRQDVRQIITTRARFR